MRNAADGWGRRGSFQMGRPRAPVREPLPGEHMHLVPLRQCLAQSLGVRLRPGVVPHGLAVDHCSIFMASGRVAISTIWFRQLSVAVKVGATDLRSMMS